MKYSLFTLAKQALRKHQDWPTAWRNPKPKSSYDVIIIGGGGHGLATAYYLAKNHGITNVAVLEKSWIGSGNIGRNTTIVRSNYMLPQNIQFYEHSVKLWETLEQELNFNVMLSQRGVLNLFHSDAQADSQARRGNAMRLLGVDAVLMDREEVRDFVPMLDFDNARYPILGGLLQKRAGTARHDAVAWGYARAASNLGVDIIQDCEVTNIKRVNNIVTSVETTQGEIRAGKVAIAVAGHTSQVAQMAGIELPIESHLLQAFVTEGLKPILDTVVIFGAGHFYISQSDKGGLVFGGAIDGYNSYSQRGSLHMTEDVMCNGMAVMPCLGRLRVLRQWAGIMDMTMDGSPLMCKTPVKHLYLNGGWCYGGFKAIPGSGWCFAHTIANDEPHSINAPFSIERFKEGSLIDERGGGPFPWIH